MIDSLCRINPKTDKYGIIGYPLNHTKSPVMHNSLFQHYAMDAIYFPFEIKQDSFKVCVKSLRELFKGFNVTVPYKEEIMPYLDQVSDSARLIGAVNTVFFKERNWFGDNTDWIGMTESLKNDYKIELENKKMMILGAGGSSRACVYGLLKNNASEVIIVNRTMEKAKKIADDFLQNGYHNVHYCGLEDEWIAKTELCDLVINTTSIGLKEKDKHYFVFDQLKKDAFVYDLIYHETDFIKRAQENGFQTGHGQGMLIRQGKESFRLWTGVDPDYDIMNDALNKSVNES